MELVRSALTRTRRLPRQRLAAAPCLRLHLDRPLTSSYSSPTAATNDALHPLLQRPVSSASQLFLSKEASTVLGHNEQPAKNSEDPAATLDVDALCRLAGLPAPPSESTDHTRLVGDLQRLLAFVAHVREVDTTHVRPLSSIAESEPDTEAEVAAEVGAQARTMTAAVTMRDLAALEAALPVEPPAEEPRFLRLASPEQQMLMDEHPGHYVAARARPGAGTSVPPAE